VRFEAAKSPWGLKDEIGALNLITPESRSRIVAEADAGKVFDLSADWFVGMPSWQPLGDPQFQIWMTHSPRGDVIDNPVGVDEENNLYTSYSGDAFSMYTHCGTHIDALNHFGCFGKIWNQFDADEHIGRRGWDVCGIDTMPPIIARAVMLDIAGLHGVEVLPPRHAIGREDLEAAIKKQEVRLEKGDIVLIRTGRMAVWPDYDGFLLNSPGLNLEGARWLCEEREVLLIGADNIGVEQIPTEDTDSWLPVHCYVFSVVGRTLLEVVVLEELAQEKVYEVAFFAQPLKLRGATGSPVRPIAFPLRSR
jgi:kynurenine formamidase